MMGLSHWPHLYVGEATVEDAEALADLHGNAFARRWSEDEFARLLADRNVFALVVRRVSLFGSRRIIGFVLVRTAADEAEILSIAVLPDRRGRGHGRWLMEEALRRLYREGSAVCFLEVDRDNRAAVGLYRSLGFAEAGSRKGYYRNREGGAGTALVMRVQLR